MKTLLLGAIAAFALLGFQPMANASAEIGKPVPDFTAADTNGNTHKLSDFKGKVVVLEWTNAECPYVVKHYDSGNMQKLQETYTAKDVVWLTVNSGKEGKQGHVTADQANALIKDKGGKQTAYILDSTGVIGKSYDAKTTPHMYVINQEGTLVYNGAIDDNNSSKQADIPTSKNYVVAALDAVLEGKEVETAKTKPYGCGVKY
jgi:peroxiredoxin